MSGITPLIDTLLHQVLGKRVDVPPAKDPNAPVKPIDPGRGPGAVHSDSRLDARRTAHSSVTTSAPASASGDTAPSADRPASTITQLSAPGARIAELLARFPAPPSALSPSRPLLATPPGPAAAAQPSPATLSPAASSPPPPAATAASSAAAASLASRPPASAPVASAPVAGSPVAGAPLAGPSTPAVAQLAERLGSSVRDSGLFYESHLGRWLGGELDRAQLAREPQMWRPLVFRPLSDPSVAPSSPSALQAPWRTTQPAGFLPSLAPVAHPRGDVLVEAGERPAGRQEPAQPTGVHESLAPLVRHQLELLAAPVLRWEGDVWSGLFMALAIHPPQREPDRREGSQQRGEEPGDEGAWRTDIQLTLPDHGTLSVTVVVGQQHLQLILATASEPLRQQLEQGRATLIQRLSGHGVGEVSMTIQRGDDNDG